MRDGFGIRNGETLVRDVVALVPAGACGRITVCIFAVESSGIGIRGGDATVYGAGITTSVGRERRIRTLFKKSREMVVRTRHCFTSSSPRIGRIGVAGTLSNR